MNNNMLDYISRIPADNTGTTYNRWLGRIATMKDAGYSLQEVEHWNGSPIDQSKWDKLPSNDDKDKSLSILQGMARKNGFSGDCSPMKKINWFKPPRDEETINNAVENARKVLESMYSDNDSIHICNGRFSTKLNKVCPDSGSITSVTLADLTEDKLKGLLAFDKGMYIQLNQVDQEEFEEYKKLKPNGSITKKHIANFKYFYIEADPPEGMEVKEFFEKSIQKLESLNLPWICHTFSGNKSIHTIIRIDAETEQQFSERIKKIHDYCIKNGYQIDEAVKDCSRWGRFFCCKRDKNYQYVMAINDDISSFQEWEQKNCKPENKILDDKGKVKALSLLDYIGDKGFRITFDKDKKMEIVRIDGNFVEAVEMNFVVNFIKKELEKEVEQDQLEKIFCFLKNSNEKFFAGLQEIEITNHTDSAEAVYLYFKNGVLQITANDTKMIPYSDIQGYIWRGAYPSMEHEYSVSLEKSDYEKFIKNITSDKKGESIISNVKNQKNAESIIGYLISRYKDPANAKAILITDRQADVDSDISTGGTGKGLFINGLQQFRMQGEIDGKDLKNEDRFCFSEFQKGQTIYAIQDIKKDFSFESIYNKITGNFIIEKKCKNKESIPFKDAPKVVLTSNFIPRGLDQESTKRRLVILELENYYNSCFTPFDEFGKRFYSEDWNCDEWNQFFAYIIFCVQSFLQNGLQPYVSEELNKKKILSTVNLSVQDWIENIFIPKNRNELDGKEWFSVPEMWSDYEEFAKFKKYTISSSKGFTIAIQNYFKGGITKKRKETGTHVSIVWNDCVLAESVE